MDVRVAGLCAVAAVAMVTACAGEPSTPDPVVVEASNQDQQDRLDVYAFYASEGKTALWADEWVCVAGAAFAVGTSAMSTAYPDLDYSSRTTQHRATFTAVGDARSLEAFEFAVAVGAALPGTPEETSRDAIGVAVAACEATLLDDEELAETVDAGVQFLADVSSAAAYVTGGPVWDADSGVMSIAPAEVDGTEPNGSELGDLERVFDSMIFEMSAAGEAGLLPYLAPGIDGDLWGVSDEVWTGVFCAVNPGSTSGCISTFTKDGREIEVVFEFELIDGEWKLVTTWADGEGDS